VPFDLIGIGSDAGIMIQLGRYHTPARIFDRLLGQVRTWLSHSTATTCKHKS